MRLAVCVGQLVRSCFINVKLRSSVNIVLFAQCGAWNVDLHELIKDCYNIYIWLQRIELQFVTNLIQKRGLV